MRKHRAKKERGNTLSALAARQLGSPLQVRKLDNFVANLGIQVAESLESLLSAKLKRIPSNEVAAALEAANDALAGVDLSDEVLFAANATPEQLAAMVRLRTAAQTQIAGLSDASVQLYDIAVDQACRHLIQIVLYLPSFQPRALAETLRRLSAQAVQLDELLARIPRTTLHAQRGIGFDHEFATAYLHHIANSLDRLELLGLSMQEQPKLALSTAYLSLNVSEILNRRRGSTRKRPEDQWFGSSEGHALASKIPVESAIGAAERTLIRGDAGSGKTTLLDWLAVTAARSAFTEKLLEWNGCMPFPIRLRSFASGPLPRPEQFVTHIWPMRGAEMPEGWVHRVLIDGKGLVLVDGVDEVPINRRREVHSWLQELVASFPRARVVVTARPAAADSKWLHGEGFSSVTLEPMSAEDIRRFIERWHDAADRAQSLPCDRHELPTAERRLLNQLANRPHLRMLASNPLLCAMLCALNLDHAAELPRSRMELYERALSMLLDIRDTKRRIAGLLDVSQKRVLLRDIAWRLTLAGRVELTKEKALEYIERKIPSMPNVEETGDVVLSHLLERSGILRQPIPGKVDFVHRTFHEYLAASEATEQGHIDTLVGHSHLDAWWETIVMACGHAKRTQADELLMGILGRAGREPRYTRRFRLLAAACLETVNEIDPEVHERIDRTIRDNLVPPRTIRETASLASIGHRVLRYLPSRLHDLSTASAVATVRAAALTGDVEALAVMSKYAEDPRYDVQKELINAWQYFDPERYAKEVLVNAPLLDGNLDVGSLHILPYVSELHHLTSLEVTIGFTTSVLDLELLAELPCLTAVDIQFHSRSVNLGPLGHHPHLKRVGLYFADRYSSIKSLAQLPELSSLTLYQRRSWSNLEFVRDLPQLRTLTIDQLGRVRDYSPLDDLTNLEKLSVWDNAVFASVTGSSWPSVKSLAIHYTTNMETISNIPRFFPRVEKLELNNVEIDSLEPVTRLPLKELYIDHEGDEIDVSVIADLDLTVRISGPSRGMEKLGPNVHVLE